MITEVRMPKLGMAMKKGAVTKWLKAEGDTVAEGADLFELATEKITAVVPSPAAGLLGRLVAQPGTELPVGALLALIGDPGDAFPAAEELAEAPAAAPAEAGAAAGPEAAPAPAGQVVPFAGIRKVVAERLTESLQTTAQVTVSREVDASGLVARRAALAAGFEAATGVRLTYTDLLVETVARLLGEHPLLNATLTEQGIVVPDAVHMGIAVALEDGLIVPVIRDAGTRPLAELARDRAELAARAQAGTLTLDQVEGGTFTISNLGSFGADAFTPIVNPPQCAILGVGRIVDKPVAVSGRVEVRPMLWLSLTFDHRIVDGAPAARFLQRLGERLGTAG